jgi:hypothetical protein
MTDRVITSYRSKHGPNLKIDAPKELVESETIKFENGVFRTDDPAVVEYLDKAIARSDSFRVIVEKIDYSAGERIALLHQKQVLLQTQSKSGTGSSDDGVRQSEIKRLEEEQAAEEQRIRDAAIANASKNDTDNILNNDETLLSEPGKGVTAPPVRVGWLAKKEEGTPAAPPTT